MNIVNKISRRNMNMLEARRIDWSTCQNLMSKIDNEQLLYTAMFKLDEYGCKETFKYNKSLGKNFIFAKPPHTEVQITCLNTQDSFNGKGEIISWTYRSFERYANGEEKEYYTVFFLSTDMYELANLINDIRLKVSAGEVKLIYKDVVDDTISLYKNDNDDAYSTDRIFDIKKYDVLQSIDDTSLGVALSVTGQIRSAAEIIKKVIKKSFITTDSIMIANMTIGSQQLALLYVRNGEGCFYAPKNKLTTMRFDTLQDIKKLNDSTDIYKVKFGIESKDKINEHGMLGLASKAVLNFIEDEPYVKGKTYYATGTSCSLAYHLTSKVLDAFLNNKSPNLALIKLCPSNCTIMIEKIFKNEGNTYTVLISDNITGQLNYFDDGIKDFVEILLLFKEKFDVVFTF